MDLSSMKILIKKVFGCLAFLRGERIKLPDFWNKEFIQIDFMVVRSGGGNVISGFFRED